MRQLNSLGQVVVADLSLRKIAFKNLKNDQHQQQSSNNKKKKKTASDKRITLQDLKEDVFVERRSGDERRQDSPKCRNRWIDSRHQSDRRKSKITKQINLVI